MPLSLPRLFRERAVDSFMLSGAHERLLYSTLFYTLIPLILARLAWRGRRLPAYRARWAERFALYRQTTRHGSLWLHAVSLGEAEAAFPLIRALQRRFPERPLLVTTTTPTGSTRVKTVLGDAVEHVYLPYDLPDAMARFLDHFRPILGVVMETEIWPNLYHACGTRNIPLALVNARLSEKSTRGYSKLPALTRACLQNLRLIAAQSQEDAERFLRLGALPERVVVMGNLKYDKLPAKDYAAIGARLRNAWFGSRPVWIAASTHEGEETRLLRIYARLRRRFPDLLLVLAPRHPERFAAVYTLCVAYGLRVARRSDGDGERQMDVFLLDTLGELPTFYAAADIAFVGGSLVPVGGHNVLEAAVLGLPIVFGPHMENFADITRRLLKAGGAVQVTDDMELAGQIESWLCDAESRKEVGARAQAHVAEGRGAVQRVVTALASLLEET